MAFTPFMPLPPGPSAHTETSTIALLLRYVAHVQETGLCGFPALEAHLQRHALELEARRAIEQAASRAAIADLALQPPVPIAGRPSQTSPQMAMADAASIEAEHLDPTHIETPVLEPTVLEPTVLEPTVLEPNAHPYRPLAPIPRALPRRTTITQRRIKAATAARLINDASGIGHPSETPDGTLLNTDTDGTTSTRTSVSAPRNPELELLLRFQDIAERGGRWDPPTLQQRLTASVAARQLDRGNSREALERLKLRSHALLGQIRASLPEASAPAPQPLVDGSLNFHRLGQLRAQLDDGLRCYGLRLDRPLQRMLQRQLRRAADQERGLQRRLRRGETPITVASELMGLADTLETVLDQWLPLDPAAMASRNALLVSIAEPESAPLQLWQPEEPANAIRPAGLGSHGR